MKDTVGSGENTPQEIEDLLNDQDTTTMEERMTEGSWTKKQLERNTDADILSIIKSSRGYLTGSRAWKTESYDSDYDYVVTQDMYVKILKDFADKNIFYHDHHVYKSLYVADMHGMYNVICVSYYDFRCWQFATKTMIGLVKEEALPTETFKDKDKVYAMFEGFRNMYRFVGEK